MRSGRCNKLVAGLAVLVMAGCAAPVERATAASVAERAPVSTAIRSADLPVYNLAWVEPGKLMRAGAVIVGGGTRLADGSAADAPEVEAAYRTLGSRYGVQAVVNLRSESAEDRAAAKACDMAFLHLPIVDGVAPSPDEVRRFFAFVDAEKARGHVVLWHCAGGIGRTGFLAAVQRLRDGWSQEDAAKEMFAMGLTQAQAYDHMPALAAFAKAAGKPTWFPADWAGETTSRHDYSEVAKALVQ